MRKNGRLFGLAAVALLWLPLVSCGSDSTSTQASVQPSGTASGTTAAPDLTSTSESSGASAPAAAATVAASAVPESTPPETSPATSATSAVLTSTTVDERPVDPVDQGLASAAVLHAEDLPAPWTVYAAGEAFRATPESCSYRPDGATTRVSNGGAQAGPTMQFGDTGAFVGSFAQAFPDESLASEYIDVINSEEWGACRAAQLQQVQTDAGSDHVVKLVTRDEPTLNENGFESYAQFDVAAPDGTVARIILLSFYRIGRTVITTTVEYAALSDADATTFHSDAYNALVAAYARVNAL